jgi:ankyrin repeat protein
LLDAGVEVNARYAHEATALMWAAAYGHLDTVNLLLGRSAAHAPQDDRGKTALAIAIEQGHAAVVEALRAAGARD